MTDAIAWTVEQLGYKPLTPAEWQASQLTPDELEQLMMPCEPLQE